MLVGARHPGATVGIVEKEYRSEVNFLQLLNKWSMTLFHLSFITPRSNFDKQHLFSNYYVT